MSSRTWVHLDGGWHTTECATRQERILDKRAEWKARWPDHCPACEGAGQTVYQFDPSPAGVSLSGGWMEESEFCPSCQCGDEAHCPRCGRVVEEWEPFQNGEACPHCGWVWGSGPDDVCPPSFDECSCLWHKDNPFYQGKEE